MALPFLAGNMANFEGGGVYTPPPSKFGFHPVNYGTPESIQYLVPQLDTEH